MSDLQTPRMAISPDALKAILQCEFRRRRLAACPTCKVPLPIFQKPSDARLPNWTIEALAECANHCSDVMGQVLSELFVKYDIKHAQGEKR